MDADHLHFEVESVQLLTLVEEAQVISCIIDGRRVVDPGGGENGEDLLIDGDIVSGTTHNILTRGADGAWRLSEGSRLVMGDGPDGCDE